LTKNDRKSYKIAGKSGYNSNPTINLAGKNTKYAAKSIDNVEKTDINGKKYSIIRRL
jgi:hypothetical protein